MPTLTPMQHAVARLEAAGVPRAEIARRVARSRDYVRVTLREARQRLDVAPGDRWMLAQALLTADVAVQVKPNRIGLRRGDPVRITGGHFAGRTGTYVQGRRTRQWNVQIGGGVFALSAKYIEPIKELA